MKSAHELILHTKTYHRDGYVGYVVDTAKSHWWGTPVKELGAFGRRKFENWIILMRPKERIKVVYGND